MPIEILMPALSPTMEEGNVTKWLKKEGDKIVAGDVIAEIETDKATMEVEAVDDGVLAKIVVPEGTEGVKVNTPIAILAVDGEDTDKAGEGIGEEEAAPAKPAKEEAAGGKDRQAAEEPSVQKEAAKVPAAPKLEAAADPDIPAGTEMVSTTVREALRDAMAEEMRRDESVFIMGEEVAEYQGAYKITQGSAAGVRPAPRGRYADHRARLRGRRRRRGDGRPEADRRVHDLQLRHAGDRPDRQLGRQDALHVGRPDGRADRVSRPQRRGGPRRARSTARTTQPGTAIFPGLKVVQPYTAADAKGLLKAAIRDPNPVIFLENEILYGQHFDVPKLDDFVLPIGKARIHKTGKDVTIVSWSIGMTYVVKAEAELRSLGIDAEIIDLRTIRPMDLDTVIASVRKTNRLVVVEEGFPQSSVGDFIANQVSQRAFDHLDAPVITVAGKDVPMPYAANLEKLALPNVGEVIEAVKAVTYR